MWARGWLLRLRSLPDPALAGRIKLHVGHDDLQDGDKGTPSIIRPSRPLDHLRSPYLGARLVVQERRVLRAEDQLAAVCGVDAVE
jgi:hypothetical protein